VPAAGILWGSGPWNEGPLPQAASTITIRIIRSILIPSPKLLKTERFLGWKIDTAHRLHQDFDQSATCLESMQNSGNSCYISSVLFALWHRGSKGFDGLLVQVTIPPSLPPSSQHHLLKR
jgi:hypothetical protein